MSTAVTPAMVVAYLAAHDAYWLRADELPAKLGEWRNGTPAKATEVALTAALAVAPAPDLSAAHAAVRKVLKHHNLLGGRPGDGVIEADLIYAVLGAARPPVPQT